MITLETLSEFENFDVFVVCWEFSIIIQLKVKFLVDPLIHCLCGNILHDIMPAETNYVAINESRKV